MLASAGATVELVEASGRLGGKLAAASAARNGDLARCVAPAMWEARRSVTSLAQDLGLGQDIVPVPAAGLARLVLAGDRFAALSSRPLSLLLGSALTPSERLALILEPTRPRGPAPGAPPDESLAQFLRRRFGGPLTDRILLAIATGIWAGDPERLSASSCVPALVALERDHGSVLGGALRARLGFARGEAGAEQPEPGERAASETAAKRAASEPGHGLVALRGGMSRIGEAAERALPVRIGARVDAILIEPGSRPTVRIQVSEAGRRHALRARLAILATDAPAAASLLTTLAPGAAAAMRAIRLAPLATVHWRERFPGESALPRALGWLASPSAGAFAAGTIFLSDLRLPGIAAPSSPPNRWTRARNAEPVRREFLTIIGGMLAPERAMASEADLVAGLAGDLARCGAGPPGDVLHVHRDPRAIAQPEIGHAARVASIASDLAGLPVLVAGSWSAAGSMHDAVTSGRAAAQQALGMLAAERARPDDRPDILATSTAGSAIQPAVMATRSLRPPAAREHLPSIRAIAAGDALPLALVGATHRHAGTAERARLAELESEGSGPAHELIEGGHATGAVVLATCSRVEWLVSSPRPEWAAELLRGAIAVRVPGARLRARTGHDAVRTLLRVSLGLDSVAEGEAAVGRQVLAAFEAAHRAGRTDRVLHACWRGVQEVIGDRRRRGLSRGTRGVQTLIVNELRRRGVGPGARVTVVGRGAIGSGVRAALVASGYAPRMIGRDASELDALRETDDVVIACTGAPAPHIVLPDRMQGTRGPLVIDVGAPAQIARATGWDLVDLETLLAGRGDRLDADSRAWLERAAADMTRRLAARLAARPAAEAMTRLDADRRDFLARTLPPLLEDLPPASAEKVRKACASFARQVMDRVRNEWVRPS